MKYSYYPGCTLKNKAKALDDYARACALTLGFELEELDTWQCCGGVYPLGHLFPRGAGGMDGIPAASVRRQPGKSPGNAGTGFYGGAPCRSPCND